MALSTMFYGLRELVGLAPRSERQAYREAHRLLAASDPDPSHIQAKIPAFLASRSWEVRNDAVKLIAKMRDEERYPALAAKLVDRREVGIVRRNCAEMMQQIGTRTDCFEQSLVSALDDSYWEVRAESARALAAIAEPSEGLEAALLTRLCGPQFALGPPHREGRSPRLNERNFEVCVCIVEAIGALGLGELALQWLEALSHDARWLVRAQTAVALVHLAARAPALRERSAAAVRNADLVCEGSISVFILASKINRVLGELEQKPIEAVLSRIRNYYIWPKRGWNRMPRN